ncbi:MAG: GNAT family N-acetyltransferase [Clostridiales bacterium]|nr:GNAT family N-acetyltransferase [Clostridiales bacterium]
MNIIPFEERYRQAFIDFNTDWIVSNFGSLEEPDRELFANLDRELDRGGMIFFAVEGETPLATCMATPMEGTTWEICKLGSNSALPHRGAGTAVFEAAMDWALDHGAERLFMLSNRKLKTALHIYEKHGFREVKLQNYEYERGDIALEYIVGAHANGQNAFAG